MLNAPATRVSLGLSENLSPVSIWRVRIAGGASDRLTATSGAIKASSSPCEAPRYSVRRGNTRYDAERFQVIGRSSLRGSASSGSAKSIALE